MSSLLDDLVCGRSLHGSTPEFDSHGLTMWKSPWTLITARSPSACDVVVSPFHPWRSTHEVPGLVLTLVFLPALGAAFAGVPDDLQQVSVTIKAGDAQGSGTIVTRQIGDDTVSFIWTAGHVVDNLRVVRQIITADGGTRT